MAHFSRGTDLRGLEISMPHVEIGNHNWSTTCKKRQAQCPFCINQPNATTWITIHYADYIHSMTVLITMLPL